MNFRIVLCAILCMWMSVPSFTRAEDKSVMQEIKSGDFTTFRVTEKENLK